ncbi:hypothetical protein ACFLYK_04415 [Candidatus Cloacimonadota bacterium]
MSYKLIILVVVLILISGCIPGDGKHTKERPAGFLWGIWHGWLSPLSLIIGIFDADIRIYETNNSGWWYDFAFYMAILGGFGGLSLSRKRRKKK